MVAAAIASFGSRLFMGHLRLLFSRNEMQETYGGRPTPIRSCTFRLVGLDPPFRVFPYGIGGFGRGGTPQNPDAQGGRGGVGIRNSLPWVDAKPPVMQAPV